MPVEKQSFTTSFSTFSWGDVFSTGFAVSLVWVYYAYSGWNASAYMANEIKNPQRTIPRSLFISTLVVTVLYLCINAVFLLSTPAGEMSGQLEVGLIAAQHIFGVTFGNIMGLLIALLLVSSISSMVFLGPRVSQVMGEDTYILRPLARRSDRGTPYIAIWVQYFISVILIITNSFELVTKYTGITLSFFALMTVAGVFVHRRRFPKANRSYKTWGYPVTPVIFILLIVWSIVYLVREDFILTFIEGKQDVMWMTLMSLLTLVSGALIYRTNRWVVYKN
jgi:Amino acid transporters